MAQMQQQVDRVDAKLRLMKDHGVQNETISINDLAAVVSLAQAYLSQTDIGPFSQEDTEGDRLADAAFCDEVLGPKIGRGEDLDEYRFRADVALPAVYHFYPPTNSSNAFRGLAIAISGGYIKSPTRREIQFLKQMMERFAQ